MPRPRYCRTSTGGRRYVLPPLAMERLETLPDGRVRLGLRSVWSDGTTAIEPSPIEFAEKLAAFVPSCHSHCTSFRT